MSREHKLIAEELQLTSGMYPERREDTALAKPKVVYQDGGFKIRCKPFKENILAIARRYAAALPRGLGGNKIPRASRSLRVPHDADDIRAQLQAEGILQFE